MISAEAQRGSRSHLWSLRGLLWRPQSLFRVAEPERGLAQGSGAKVTGGNYHGNHKASGPFSWVPDSSMILDSPPQT